MSESESSLCSDAAAESGVLRSISSELSIIHKRLHFLEMQSKDKGAEKKALVRAVGRGSIPNCNNEQKVNISLRSLLEHKYMHKSNFTVFTYLWYKYNNTQKPLRTRLPKFALVSILHLFI